MKLNTLRSRIRRAFTLIEVLVVISIFVLLLAIAVPAFSAMLYSSEQSLVENSIRIAMGSARNYAASSPTGQDAAAVFLYDADTKKTSIVTCTFAGTLMDKTQVPGAPTTGIIRDVFAVAPGIEPIQLTSGWTIRGFAPADSIDEDWYETTYGPNSSPNRIDQANWLLPESGFFKDNVSNSGRDRQSFMIRFEGGTGMVKTSSPHTALVHYPSPNQMLHATWPPIPTGSTGYTNANNPLNPDNETDDYRYVRRVLAWPGQVSGVPGGSTGSAGYLSLARKQQILGDESADTILCKSIGQFAVCSERRLARGVGVELTQSTGTVYQSTTQPLIDPALRDKINLWIVNRDPNNPSSPADSDARIFTIQRYLGWLQEVTGTEGGLGVGS